jgi:hypothetical protein
VELSRFGSFRNWGLGYKRIEKGPEQIFIDCVFELHVNVEIGVVVLP